MGVTQRQTQQLQPRRLREWVPGSSLLQTSNFSFLQLPNSKTNQPVKMAMSKIRQNYHEDCEALINKQINMELRLLRLSLHELLLQPRRPSAPWFRGTLQEGVERGARPRHEVDGVPDQEGRPRCLPGHRQADHDGLGQPYGSHGGRARA